MSTSVNCDPNFQVLNVAIVGATEGQRGEMCGSVNVDLAKHITAQRLMIRITVTVTVRVRVWPRARARVR